MKRLVFTIVAGFIGGSQSDELVHERLEDAASSQPSAPRLHLEAAECDESAATAAGVAGQAKGFA